MQSRAIIDNGSIPTLCRQCAQHCGIYVHVEEGRVTKISGNKSHPVNLGMVCPKGREAPQWVYHPDRLTGCLKRTGSGGFTVIAYDRALDEIAQKMRAIKDRSGARALSTWTGEAIGFLQQEAYAQRFIHAFESPNFFTADSVCFALRLMAYATCQGYWTYPPDFEKARMTILWGSNPAHSHPSFMQRINRGTIPALLGVLGFGFAPPLAATVMETESIMVERGPSILVPGIESSLAFQFGDGRIVVGKNENRRWSDDGGSTWRTGAFQRTVLHFIPMMSRVGMVGIRLIIISLLPVRA